jgi:hypothetical protein
MCGSVIPEDVLSIEPDNPNSTFIGDLAGGNDRPVNVVAGRRSPTASNGADGSDATKASHMNGRWQPDNFVAKFR